jgi:hypothetical protein
MKGLIAEKSENTLSGSGPRVRVRPTDAPMQRRLCVLVESIPLRLANPHVSAASTPSCRAGVKAESLGESLES